MGDNPSERTSHVVPSLVVETVSIGDHLPLSERVATNRNPALDGVIDFIGGTMGTVLVLTSTFNVLM